MKTISRRICGALLGLCVLGSIRPVARADEMEDRANQQAQAEREARDRANQEAQAEQAARDRAYQEAQAEQAARDRAYQEQQQQRDAQAWAQKEQEAWNKWNKDMEWYQAERDAWYKWNQEVQQWREKEQKQKEWDDWLDRITGRTDWPAPAPNPAPAKAPVARPPAARRIWFQRQAVAQQSRVILNPFAVEKLAVNDLERVPQQATLTGLQVIENPFVRSPK